MALKPLLLGTIFDPTDPRALNSITLDGAGERYFGVDTLSIGNDWSYSQWFLPDSFPSNRGLLSVDTISAGGATVINAQIGDFGAGSGSLLILTRRQNNAGLKNFEWDTVFTVDTWTHMLFTWDGTDLDLYLDGTLTAPSIKNADAAGVMSSTGTVRLFFASNDNGGQPFGPGNVGPFGIWDTSVSAAEAAEIFAGKFSIDLRSNTGSYVSSSSLIGYWRPGFDDEGFTDLSGVIDFGVDGIGQPFGIDLTNIEVNSP